MSTSMFIADPVRDLVHDHAALNRRVLALATTIETLRAATYRTTSRALITSLYALRDPLFFHFAREEEGLFPFVAEINVELVSQLQAMEAVHDTICGAIARMCQLASADAPIGVIAQLFERFQRVYAAHARTESALLASVDARLTEDQRRDLAARVVGL